MTATRRRERRAEIRTDVDRTSLDLNPDFEAMGAFKMAAPPDYHAENGDFPEIRWRLDGGKIVPLVDDRVVASVDKMLAEARAARDARAHMDAVAGASSTGVPVPSWPWWALITIVAVLGCVVGGTVLGFRLRRRALHRRA